MTDVFPPSVIQTYSEKKSEFSQVPSSGLLRDITETSTSRHEMRVT